MAGDLTSEGIVTRFARTAVWRAVDAGPVFIFGEGLTAVSLTVGKIGDRPVFVIKLWNLDQKHEIGSAVSDENGPAEAILTFPTFERMAFTWKALMFGDVEIPPQAAEKLERARQAMEAAL